MNADTHEHRGSHRRSPGNGVLWASAFIIGALVLLQASRLPMNPAYGEMGASSEGFTVLTVDSGRGTREDPMEMIYVIDSRSEIMMIYEIEDARRNEFILRMGIDLAKLFHTARQR